ncbi:MAG: hypothetical protein ACM3VT_01110 [Solirubrobacterales bacterium]
MDLCHTETSNTHSLTEQIAQEVFEILPEQGPILVIMDREGNSWSSRPDEFGKLGICDAFLCDLRSKVDDGAEPVITQIGDASVTIAQLATDHSNCGYVAVVLPQYTPESTLTHIDLVEAMLNQITLIARLVEKTSVLTQRHMNHYQGLALSVN